MGLWRWLGAHLLFLLILAAVLWQLHCCGCHCCQLPLQSTCGSALVMHNVGCQKSKQLQDPLVAIHLLRCPIPNFIRMLSNQVLSKVMSICSSLAFSFHNLAFIAVSLYSPSFLSKRQGWSSSQSTRSFSCSVDRIRDLGLFL